MNESLDRRPAPALPDDYYRLFADCSYDWETWVDVEGNYLYSSPSCERITGYTTAEFTDDPHLLSKIVHPEDQAAFKAHVKTYLSPLPAAEIDFRIICRDGEVRWISHCCQPVCAAEGTFLGRRATNRDITKRKAAEAECTRLACEAEAREGLLEATIEQMPGGLIIVAPPDGKIIIANDLAQDHAPWINPQAPTIFEAVPHLPRTLEGDPIDISQWAIGQALHQGVVTRDKRVMMDGANGPVLLSIHAQPVHDSEGRTIAAVMTSLDVTAQVQAQAQVEALMEIAQQRAAELDTVINAIADAVSISDAEGRLLRYNNVAKHLLRYESVDDLSYENRLTRCVYKRADGSVFATEELPMSRSLRGETVSSEIIELIWPDGSSTWMTSSSAPIYDAEGKLRGTVLTNTDLTAYRQSQQQIEELGEEARRRAAELDAVIGSIADGVLFYDLQGRTQRANEAAIEMLRWSGERLNESIAERLERGRVRHTNGEPVSTADTPASRALRGETVQNQVTVLGLPSGNDIWISASGAPVRDSGGRHLGAVVTFKDITPLVAAQKRAERRADELDTIINAIADGVIIYDRDGKVQRTNSALKTMLGLSASEKAIPIMAPFLFDLGGEQRQRIQKSDHPAMCALRGETVAGLPLVLFTGTEHEVNLIASAAPLQNSEGGISGAVVTLTDVTRLQRTQEQLQRYQDHLEDLIEQRTAELVASERKYRELVENVNGAIVRWDANGTIIFVNEYLERLFGYDPGELIGRNVRALMPPVDQDGHALEYLPQQILADPGAFELHENENVTKHGKLLWMSWANRILYDEQGNFASVMAVGTDRTQQHETEKKLRHLAAELALAEQKERQRIATGLHDDICQLLAFAKMKLSATAYLDSKHEIDLANEEIAKLLAEAIDHSRSLITELSPPLLTEKGIAGAILWAADRVRDQHGSNISVKIIGETRRLHQDVEITVFQGVKEMLNNVVKHAQASRVIVCLAYDANTLEITVEDDGVGFDPESIRVTESGGFGLWNIRDRLDHIGGELLIHSTPGSGSRIAIAVPIE